MKKYRWRLTLFILCATTCFMTSCSLFPPPEVKLQLNKTRVYVGFPPFDLSGGMPEGGVFSGEGVVDGKFYPENAGSGVHEIKYTYRGVSASGTIEVVGPKKKNIDPNCPLCSGSGKIKCSSRIDCTSCKGAGRFFDHTCSECDGEGRVRTKWKLLMGKRDCPECGGVGQFYRQCSDCRGTGKEKCPKCKGTGKAPCPRCK